MPSCGNSLPFASTTARQAQPANSKAMNHPATLDVDLIAFYADAMGVSEAPPDLLQQK